MIFKKQLLKHTAAESARCCRISSYQVDYEPMGNELSSCSSICFDTYDFSKIVLQSAEFEMSDTIVPECCKLIFKVIKDFISQPTKHYKYLGAILSLR